MLTTVGDMMLYFRNNKEVVFAKPGDIKSIAAGFEKLILNNQLSIRIAESAYYWMDENLNYVKSASKIDFFLTNL